VPTTLSPDSVSQPDAREQAPRRAMMGILAAATAEEMATGLSALGEVFDYTEVRPPQTGLVMMRGRMGGDGAPFNLGEATVTRAAVRLSTGEVGFSYLLGRDCERARLAALCDALWQNESRRDRIERHVIEPVRKRLAAQNERVRAETAATRVDFFTLVRGDD
jgi:alpha-D-ribose 1-methylphosphonate 5-triphosphate synthase subunit PhnG